MRSQQPSAADYGAQVPTTDEEYSRSMVFFLSMVGFAFSRSSSALQSAAEGTLRRSELLHACDLLSLRLRRFAGLGFTRQAAALFLNEVLLFIFSPRTAGWR